jgi:hypothetical protein
MQIRIVKNLDNMDIFLKLRKVILITAAPEIFCRKIKQFYIVLRMFRLLFILAVRSPVD